MLGKTLIVCLSLFCYSPTDDTMLGRIIHISPKQVRIAEIKSSHLTRLQQGAELVEFMKKGMSSEELQGVLGPITKGNGYVKDYRVIVHHADGSQSVRHFFAHVYLDYGIRVMVDENDKVQSASHTYSRRGP